MPRTKKKDGELSPRDVSRLNEAIGNYPAHPEPKDIHFARETEADQIADAAAEKAYERAEDEKGSAKEYDLKLLLEEMEELKSRNAVLELNQKQAFGDYSQMAADHPFELMIHTHEELAKNYDVPVTHNGKTWLIKRGVAVRVPKFVIDILGDAKVKGQTRVPNPVTGNPEDFFFDQHRFPFSARPLPL